MFHLFWFSAILMVTNSLFIWGLFAASQYSININKEIVDKEILWRLKYFAEQLSEYIGKPLILCPICMSSFYGTLFCLFSYNINEFIYIPIYIICLAGLQYLIYKLIE